MFVRDLEANTVTLVSRATGADGAKGNGYSVRPAISADGRFVVFTSEASNLHPDDSDTTRDVFVRDLQANTTTLISRAAGPDGAKGDGSSFYPAISADGRYVAFTSQATNLHPDDADDDRDAYVRDLQENTTTLVTRATGADGAKGDDDSGWPAISADGRFVAFEARASNLHPDDGDTGWDVFVRDLEANTTTLVSRAAGADGARGDGPSSGVAISGDGRFVAFEARASNLHPDDGDSGWDVFVRDLAANTITLVSRAAGATGAKGNGSSDYPAISADGRFVAFGSSAMNLHPDDSDWTRDVLVRDLQANTTTLVSRAAGADGAKGNEYSYAPAISADGRFVALESEASNLHPDDNDTNSDVFRRDVLGPPPDAAADAYQAGEDTPLAVAAPGVLANDIEPAFSQLRLAARCVRRTAAGKVRVRMTLRMARPAPLQVQIDRAIASKGRRTCAHPNPTRNRARRNTRFRKVATLRRSPTAAAAAGLPTSPAPAGRRRLTLDLRLTPGLYRLTVRAQLDHNRLSPPARRYLRVIGSSL